LHQVHARDTAGQRGRARGAITELSLSLGPGIHAILGAPEDGTFALLDVVTGARAPLRGKVSVDGSEPFHTPRVRARIGALTPEPGLPPASSVGAAIRVALRARGEDEYRFDAVLDPLGLSALHARPVRSLSFAEARAVELALALTTPAALLIALHEPLSDVAVSNLHLVRSRLRELASARACVLVTTSSPADARMIADRIHVLHKGVLVREVGGDSRGLGLAGRAELTAWVADTERDGNAAEGARALAAALSRAPFVHGVSWEEEAPPLSASKGPGVALVRIRAETLEACSAALIDAAMETGITLAAIAPSAPDLAEVRTATDTLLRMRWFERRPGPPLAPKDLASRSGPAGITSLPLPSSRSPVEDGGPLGRPKSIPSAPWGEDMGIEAPRSAAMLPGPPPLPNIPLGPSAMPADEPDSAPPTSSSTVNESKR
jgi:ABC-2 type transport system ATP-binding protein